MRIILKNIILLLLLPILFSCSAIDSEKKNKTLKGYYSYMADAGIFIDCETNKKYPVAFEADNISLESAYLKIVENPGEKIIVTLAGHFESRPKMEGDGKKEFLKVDRFYKIWPHIDCVRNLGTANLENTFWSLRNIGNISSKELFFDKYPNFMIRYNQEVKGFGGCNNFFGKSTINGDTLKFTNINDTRKMCDKNMDVEAKLFQVFENTNRYKIYGEFLYLYNEEKLLAVFESAYFN